MNFKFFSILNFLEARLQRYSIWLCHFRSEDIKTPRCLWELTFLITSPWKTISGMESLSFLLDTSMDSVLGGLKVTSHWWAQLLMRWRSLFRVTWASSRSLLVTKRQVSSANIRIWEDWIIVDRSLMYIKNKRGPNTDPWGTPAEIWPQSEHCPFIITLCCLSCR